ncbi:hypothetical protein BGZ76_004738, partial [Entomortierella beljakovae]
MKTEGKHHPTTTGRTIYIIGRKHSYALPTTFEAYNSHPFKSPSDNLSPPSNPTSSFNRTVMKFSLKLAALSALAAASFAAPVEKRETNDAIIAACFAGLVLTGSWSGTCKAAVAVDLGLIRSISIAQLTLDFTTTNPWAPTIASSSLTAGLLPLTGILPIRSVQQHVLIADNGVQVGHYDSPWASASTSWSSMKTTIPTSKLSIFSDSQTAFSQFIASVTSKESYPLTLKGAVDAKIRCGIFGYIPIYGIGFNAVVPLPGLNGLKTFNYKTVLGVTVGAEGFTQIHVIDIPNPSYLTVKLGDVAFTATSANGNIGIAKVKALTLVPGSNYIVAGLILDFSSPAVGQLLGDLAGGATVSLTLKANNQTSSNAALNAGLGLSGLTSTLTVTGLPNTPSRSPFTNWSVKIPTDAATSRKVQATATFQSPYYGLPLDVTQLQSDNGAPAYVTVSGTGTIADGFNLFYIINSATFSLGGTASATKTFDLQLPQYASGQTAQLQAVVTYAQAHGYIPAKISMSPQVTIG